MSQPRPTPRPKADFDGFWAKQAKRLSWQTEPTQILDWSNPPFAKWFADGTLNAAYNCLDRHIEAGNGDRVAFYFEGEPGDTRVITYAQLAREVKQAANALLELGVKAGDRVAIYLPMIPEAVVAMLACARIGARVVFGGFSSDALYSRVIDCGVQIVITADGGFRRGTASALKPAVDEALKYGCDVRHVLVVRRTNQDVPMEEGRDCGGTSSSASSPTSTNASTSRRAPALCDVHLRQHGQAKRHSAHHRRLPGRCLVHPLGSLRLEAGDRHFLDGCRHRLGDRALLPGVRAARERHDVGHEGHARHPAQGPLVGDHREVPRVHLVLCSDGDPHIYEVGIRRSRGLRSVVSAHLGHGGRTDQP